MVLKYSPQTWNRFENQQRKKSKLAWHHVMLIRINTQIRVRTTFSCRMIFQRQSASCNIRGRQTEQLAKKNQSSRCSLISPLSFLFVSLSTQRTQLIKISTSSSLMEIARQEKVFLHKKSACIHGCPGGSEERARQYCMYLRTLCHAPLFIYAKHKTLCNPNSQTDTLSIILTQQIFSLKKSFVAG